MTKVSKKKYNEIGFKISVIVQKSINLMYIHKNYLEKVELFAQVVIKKKHNSKNFLFFFNEEKDNGYISKLCERTKHTLKIAIIWNINDNKYIFGYFFTF